MKKQLLLSSMFVAACLCSCSDDTFDGGKVNAPVKEGSEITFGTSLSGDALDETSVSASVANANTRTVYGDRTTTGVPVYWKDDGDTVAIFCAQSPQPSTHLVSYVVKPQTDAKNTSASVTKIGDVGLQWGAEDEHRFFAFYPSSAVKGAVVEHDATGIITANIPTLQNPTSWRQGELDGKKTYFGLPNMNYAYMYAYTSCKKSELNQGDPINLVFKNLVTVVDITIQGPESGDPMQVSSITLRAKDGQNTILTGDFTCDIKAPTTESGAATAECTAKGSFDTQRNYVTISGNDPATGKAMTLGQNEQLNVKAYIIPDDETSHAIKPRTLEVAVTTVEGGTTTKTLQSADVVPHKINRVILPHINRYGTKLWMSSGLEAGTYLSEISMPGSKFSYLTSDNVSSGHANFQNYDITKQFEDGVRAFIVQCGANVSYDKSGGWNPTYTYKSCTMPIHNGGGDNLEDCISKIASALSTAENTQGYKHECAVVMVTAYEGEVSGNLGSSDNAKKHMWMDAITHKLKDLANTYPIYADEITANTTLGDVAGKIVIKVNWNSGMDSYATNNDTAPALFSQWTGAKDTKELLWGSPKSTHTPLTWMYTEATNVGSNTEVTADNKVGYAEEIFNNSVDIYKSNDAHDTWFMVDCGGVFTNQVIYNNQSLGTFSGENQSDAAIELSKWLNPIITSYLQTRTENASLGLVFFNFADKQADSGQLYGTDWLIQTIIDNNWKYARRVRPDSTGSN